jgi:hypothetical protein
MHSYEVPLESAFDFDNWIPDWLREWALSRRKSQRDRRVAPRKLVANLTAYYWEGTGTAGHVVRDISDGGAFILADFKWPKGTILTMTLQLRERTDEPASPAPVVIRATVVRQVQDGVGIQFLCSNKEERKSLSTFLQSIRNVKYK